MPFALLTLLTLCPSSAEATEALHRESWGAGLSVVVEGGSPTGLDVLLRRGDQLIRSGHLELASDSCSLNLRGVVIAMHAWTRALDWPSEASAAVVPRVVSPFVPPVETPAEPVMEALQPPRSKPPAPRSAAPARKAVVRGPSYEPMPETTTITKPAAPTSPAPTLLAAPPEEPLSEVYEAAPASAAAAHVWGVELGVLGGMALPGPFLDVDIRAAVTFGRWGIIAGGGTQTDTSANVAPGFVSLAGRVRFQPFEGSGIDLVAGFRLGDLLLTSRLLHPPIADLAAAVEWHQRIIGPVGVVLAAEARAPLNYLDAPHAFESESSVVSVNVSAGVEVKVW